MSFSQGLVKIKENEESRAKSTPIGKLITITYPQNSFESPSCIVNSFFLYHSYGGTGTQTKHR